MWYNLGVCIKFVENDFKGVKLLVFPGVRTSWADRVCIVMFRELSVQINKVADY